MPVPQAPSLRKRLMLIAAVTICVTVSLVGLSLSYSFTRYIERRVQQELDSEWLELAAAFSLDSEGRPVLSKDLSDPRYGDPYGRAYWRISSDGGEALLRSRSLWDGDLTARGGGPLHPRADSISARGPAGATVEVISRRVTIDSPAGPRSFELAVAFDDKDIRVLRASFAFDVAAPLAVVAIILIAGAWLQTSQGLRPFRRLREQLTAIHRGESSQIGGAFPEEVEPVVRDLNDLLRRQDDLLRRARERAGDLAHGLKTPLTILTAEAQRMEDQGNEGDAQALREQIALMLSHVERELARARTHGESVAAGTLTDARETTERLLALVRRMPRGESIRWDNAVPYGARIRMAPDDFGEIVGNLLDNARKWATARVRVSADLAGENLQVWVDDDGPGISEELRGSVVERGTTGGDSSGLGLAIVNDVLAGYGTKLTLQRSPAGGCRAGFAIAGRIDPAARATATVARAANPIGAGTGPR